MSPPNPASTGGGGTERNFWLWGSWGKQKMKNPYLTQKVDGKIHDIVIGTQFIIALREDGSLESWGEDKKGNLGLGADIPASNEPKRIRFPAEFDDAKDKVVDIQHGRNHLMALTQQGAVYTWGDNAFGQCGLGDLHTHFEPARVVDALRDLTVTQIVAVDNMSYALTSHGVVYAWGDNAEGVLGLEHDTSKVPKPEPMMRLKDTHVQKLMVKEVGGSHKSGKTVIGLVGLARPLEAKDRPGGFQRELHEPRPSEGKDADQEEAKEAKQKVLESEIFQSVHLMRKVMENTLSWWNHLLAIRHGSPYEDEENNGPMLEFPGQDQDSKPETCSTLELDTYVDPIHLETAAKEVKMLLTSATEQLKEIGSRGANKKNVGFLLSLFIDDCRLRYEKINSTLAARLLKTEKTDLSRMPSEKPGDEKALEDSSVQLTSQLRKLRKLQQPTITTRWLQECLIMAIECKLQANEAQMEMLKATKSQRSPDPWISTGMILKDWWLNLRKYSIYELYNKKRKEQGSNGPHKEQSDEDFLQELVVASDKEIDAFCTELDWNLVKDVTIPEICYQILLDNANLRKMCNKYQLAVLMMQRQRQELEEPANPQKK